ncbi:nose resistant to fluoxetine protein 6 [Orussus abietinus]|uniref:nose resistant to fluoxetine protein 6 n=1 Tax=Orussus abietinus TaxID=222816 RepID=UPI000626511F|nr:nose resistant to fluoxetine protein 6 [Orussus abietinus]
MANLVLVATVLAVPGIFADSKNILKIDSPTMVRQMDSGMTYDNYYENMLPLLSRDLSLMEQAIGMIEDSTCRDHCQMILQGLHNLTAWSVKFYDASGKFPVGVLGGSVYELGNFDECLGIGGDNDPEDAPEGVRGQYCLGEVGVNAPEVYLNQNDSMWRYFKDTGKRYHEFISKLYWGICVPASCSSKDVEDVIRRVLAVAFSGSRLKLSPRIPEKSCYKHEDTPVDGADVTYLVFIVGVATLSLMGTIYHILCLRNRGEVHKGLMPQILLLFSMLSNTMKLLGPANKDELNLDCIYGIRFISMALIICGHVIIFVVGGPMMNRNFLDEAVPRVENSIFVNNALLVDTFLFISGFLFSRLLLKELDRRKSINFVVVYLYRFLRLTPAYLVVVGLYVTWLNRLDAGPLWSRMITERERCRTSWWANILYINNYVSTDNICMFQSWYLAADTQLFILAPLVVYPLWRWRKWGEHILATVISVSFLTPFIDTLVNARDPTMMAYTSELKDLTRNQYYTASYIKTHIKAMAYVFGLAFGYILYRVQTSGYTFSKNAVRCGWLMGTTLLLAAMFSISLFYGPRKYFTSIEAAFFASLHRAFWSIGTGWVLIACITNNAGPVGNILKWRAFVPLSRLTYCAYLVNGLVELHAISTIRSPEYLSKYALMGKMFSHMSVTFLMAMVLSVIFESPIIALEKLLLREEKKRRSHQKEQKTEETSSTTA